MVIMLPKGEKNIKYAINRYDMKSIEIVIGLGALCD